MSDLVEANQIILALYKNIGQQMRSARERRGVKQQDVGDPAGLSRSSVANIESGSQRIQVHTLIAFCQALGCDSADVITKAAEGSEPMAQTLPESAMPHTAKLRKNLVTIQGTITRLLAELPDEK